MCTSTWNASSSMQHHYYRRRYVNIYVFAHKPSINSLLIIIIGRFVIKMWSTQKVFEFGKVRWRQWWFRSFEQWNRTHMWCMGALIADTLKINERHSSVRVNVNHVFEYIWVADDEYEIDVCVRACVSNGMQILILKCFIGSFFILLWSFVISNTPR